MEPSQILIVVAVAIGAAISIIGAIKKRTTFDRLHGMLAAGDFDGFFKLIDAPFTRALYPAYNLMYFKLNAYLIQGDNERAHELLEQLLAHKTAPKQRVDLVIKAFNIYVGQQDRMGAKAMLKEIEGWTDENARGVQRECRRIYDIALKGSSAYIEEMKDEIAQASGTRRGQLEYFLSVQYENCGDKERAAEYLKRAGEDAFQIPASDE